MCEIFTSVGFIYSIICTQFGFEIEKLGLSEIFTYKY